MAMINGPGSRVEVAVTLRRAETRHADRFSGQIPRQPAFERYIGIDYSGAKTPSASLKGLRVYQADLSSRPAEVPPPPSPRTYWTRRGIAEWLLTQLSEDVPTLVGIDHGFSCPLRYFEAHHLAPDWSISGTERTGRHQEQAVPAVT